MTRTVSAVIGLSFILLLQIGCSKDKSVDPLPPAGFHYTAYDTAGTLVVDGWLTLIVRDSSHVNGEWHLARVNNGQNIGPQTGDGLLAGEFDHGTLLINLNPGYADNNVFLSGQFNAHIYSGSWNWSGFPGVLNRGTFQAVRP